MQKILFIGLNGAGKTAVYQRFFGKKAPSQLEKMLPTRGIAKYDHDFLRSDVEIIDAGGGKQFRQGYIGNKELVSNLSAVVYFVDVQDQKSYQEAANFLITWTKSVANYLKGVKGYILFHKIDPGTESQIKLGLQQLASLIAPLDQVFPGTLIKSITSIYNDTSNEFLQRLLLDTLPKKMSEPKQVAQKPRPVQQPTQKPPVKQPVSQPPVKPPVSQAKPKESYLTKPVDTKPPMAPTTKEVKPPSVKPPQIKTPESKPTIVPPTSDISRPMEEEEQKQIREKTAERLTDIIEASLDTNHEFVAIAVFTEDVECVVGAVQQEANKEILNLIEGTLHKINLEQYMDKLGKVRIGGEGHIKIDVYDIFFEKVSPEHLSTIICSSIEEDTLKNMQQLNRYLNQALSVTPEGVSEDSFRRADLIAELKMRLYNRGKSVDHVG